MRKLTLVVVLCLAALSGPSCCTTPPTPTPAVVQLNPATPFVVALGALRTGCPLGALALVQITQIPGHYWGLTWWDGERFIILIDSRQPMHSIINTLEHEWAHAMVWGASQRIEDDSHGPLWGVAQARCYRVVLGALTTLDEASEEPSQKRRRCASL